MRFGQFDSTMCKGTVWAQPITAFSAIFYSRNIFITHFTNLALNLFIFLKSLINIPKNTPPNGKNLPYQCTVGAKFIIGNKVKWS